MTALPKKLKHPKIVRNRRLKAQVYERDQGFCSVCGTYSNNWIHEHVQPLSMGGADTLDNSETRCPRHASEKTSKEATARAKADRLAARHELTRSRRRVSPRAGA